MIPVMHVITRLTVGGSSENTVSMIEQLEKYGYTATLVLGPQSEEPVVEDARLRGCRIVELDGLVREVSPARDVAAVLQLYRLFRRARPAIVHTHTSKAGFVGRMAAWLAGVPAVIHQPHGHIFYGYWSRARTAMFVGLERIAAPWTDTILALTPREIEENLERGIGRRRAVRGGAERRADPGAARRGAVAGGGPAEAGAAGRRVRGGRGRALVPIKGFDLLVAALAEVLTRVPDTHLLLIGDGVERGALEAQAAALGVAERLHITGSVSDVTPLLPAADVLAAPSRNEGMGRVLVEAMALGLPAVGTRVGGIADVIVRRRVRTGRRPRGSAGARRRAHRARPGHRPAGQARRRRPAPGRGVLHRRGGRGDARRLRRAGALAPPGPVRRRALALVLGAEPGRRRPGRRARARARCRARALRPDHRRLHPGGAGGAGRPAGDRRPAARRELPAARGLRPAAVPRADAGEPARALGRRRARGLLRPRGRGPAATAARAARSRGRGDAALSLDRLGGRARPHRAQPPEERPRVRPHRSGRAGLAARRRPATGRPLHRAVADRCPARAAARARGDAAAPPPPGPPPTGPRRRRRRTPPGVGARWSAVRRRRRRPRTRLAVHDRSVPDLVGPGHRALPGSDRSRRAARRRRRVVVPGGARHRRAAVRSGAGGLAHRALSRRPAEDVPLHGVRRRVRGHQHLRAARGRLGPPARRVRRGASARGRRGGWRSRDSTTSPPASRWDRCRPCSSSSSARRRACSTRSAEGGCTRCSARARSASTSRSSR